MPRGRAEQLGSLGCTWFFLTKSYVLLNTTRKMVDSLMSHKPDTFGAGWDMMVASPRHASILFLPATEYGHRSNTITP